MNTQRDSNAGAAIPFGDESLKFARSELALAGQISRNNFDGLDKNGLAPKSRDFVAFQQMAIMGGIYLAGFGLAGASRLADVIVRDHLRYDVTALENLLRKLERSDQKGLRAELAASGRLTAWGIHGAVWQESSLYRQGSAGEWDQRIEIADREFVFWKYPDRAPNLLMEYRFDDEIGPKRECVARLRGLERNVDFHVDAFIELLPPLDDPEGVERVGGEFAAGWKNAVGVASINISLATRNAMDRVAAARASRKTRRKGQSG